MLTKRLIGADLAVEKAMIKQLTGTDEAPGPSVFPSGEPGVSGDFWGSQEGCQGPQLSLATRGEDWASQGQPKGMEEEMATHSSIFAWEIP